MLHLVHPNHLRRAIIIMRMRNVVHWVHPSHLGQSKCQMFSPLSRCGRRSDQYGVAEYVENHLEKHTCWLTGYHKRLGAQMTGGKMMSSYDD